VTFTGGTGACVSGANYWDLGVRATPDPATIRRGVQLAPTYSVLRDVSAASGYSGAALHNTVPIRRPEPVLQGSPFAGERWHGLLRAPGISDATVPTRSST